MGLKSKRGFGTLVHGVWRDFSAFLMVFQAHGHMSFDVEARRFDSAESGTDSFKLLYKAAFGLMTGQPVNTAFLFVIGVAAHNYLLKYEDHGVSAEFADKAKAVMIGFNQKIAQALTSVPDVGIKLLGEISANYQFRVHEF